MNGFASFCYVEGDETLSIIKFFDHVPTEVEAKDACGLLLAKELSSWEWAESHFSTLTETDILQTLAEWLNPIAEGIKGWDSYAALLETFLDNDYHPVFQFGPVEADGCFVKWTE